jgi:hypothetical protein
MTLTAEHLSPIVALIAGILILILPSLLNYVVAIYLIVTGLIGLNGIYHFINWYAVRAHKDRAFDRKHPNFLAGGAWRRSRISLHGTFQTWRDVRVESAFGVKPGLTIATADFRVWPTAALSTYSIWTDRTTACRQELESPKQQEVWEKSLAAAVRKTSYGFLELSYALRVVGILTMSWTLP